MRYVLAVESMSSVDEQDVEDGCTDRLIVENFHQHVSSRLALEPAVKKSVPVVSERSADHSDRG